MGVVIFFVLCYYSLWGATKKQLFGSFCRSIGVVLFVVFLFFCALFFVTKDIENTLVALVDLCCANKDSKKALLIFFIFE